jgi:hypothetical protein
MRVAFAVFLFIHAFAHGVGFITQTLALDTETSGEATFLFTGLEAGHWALRLMGVVWLLVGVGLVVAGIGVLRDAEWALPVLVAATVASTALSLVWVKAAPMGLVANAVVLAVLLVPALNDRVLA